MRRGLLGTLHVEMHQLYINSPIRNTAFNIQMNCKVHEKTFPTSEECIKWPLHGLIIEVDV